MVDNRSRRAAFANQTSGKTVTTPAKSNSPSNGREIVVNEPLPVRPNQSKYPAANGNSNDAANTTSEKVRIRADGHVGIGTTSPASTLHVNGSMTVGNGAVSMFRPMQAKSVGTKYTAETDGFVVYWGYRKNMRFNLWLAGQSTALIDENLFFSAASSDANSFTWPIAKGESWQFSQIADYGGSSSLWWRPIGLGN